MLRNTFCHIPGIGGQRERTFWSAGVHSWDQFIEADPKTLRLGRNRMDVFRTFIDKSMARLDGGDPHFFEELLPADQHWRLFPHFRDSTAYLDIETTGMGGPGDHITTIALYDGEKVHSYVHGRNLRDFKKDLKSYRVIVTYNGKCFDVPFIRQDLGVPVDQVHIDLRYVLKSLGYGGGLKACEKNLGIDRGDLDGVDGYFAVLLWDEFKRTKREEALETLLAYNTLDVVDLEKLMVTAYNLKLKETPFHFTHALPDPAEPPLPFKPDMKTIEKVRRRMESYL